MQRLLISITTWGILSILLIGCVSAPGTYPPITGATSEIYHRVEKGQTLWRIAKMYNTDLDGLLRINKIDEPAKIEVGQLILIPREKNITIRTPYVQAGTITEEDFIWPLKGRVIAKFGQNKNNVVNKGVDIAAPFGCEVLASRSGIVTYYDEDLSGLGKTVIIDHGDNFLTVYARNSEVFVKAGDKVRQGATIAKVGSAGRDRASYLHFEIRKGHTPQNPYYYLP